MKMKKQRNYLLPHEAAPIIGFSASYIRERMRSGDWKIGICIDRRKEGRKSVFRIYPELLEELKRKGV